MSVSGYAFDYSSIWCFAKSFNVFVLLREPTLHSTSSSKASHILFPPVPFLSLSLGRKHVGPDSTTGPLQTPLWAALPSKKKRLSEPPAFSHYQLPFPSSGGGIFHAATERKTRHTVTYSNETKPFPSTAEHATWCHACRPVPTKTVKVRLNLQETVANKLTLPAAIPGTRDGEEHRATGSSHIGNTSNRKNYTRSYIQNTKGTHI